VLLPPAKKRGHRKNPTGKPGTLSLTVACDQGTSITLTGKLTAMIPAKTKHGKKRKKTIAVPTVRSMVMAGSSRTIPVKLPKAALAALRAGNHESATFTMTARNANGTATATATATIAKLKPVKT
jgi:hypothetical protein